MLFISVVPVKISRDTIRTDKGYFQFP